MKFLAFSQTKLGSSLSLPAHGRAGARATSSLAAHFAKRNTKFGGGGKARAGKNSFPPTPFLFARPSAYLFQNSASGFSLKKVRISFRVRSQLLLVIMWCCLRKVVNISVSTTSDIFFPST